MGGYGCSGAGGGFSGGPGGKRSKGRHRLVPGTWSVVQEPESGHVAERGGEETGEQALHDRHLRGLQSIFPVGLGLISALPGHLLSPPHPHSSSSQGIPEHKAGL